MQIHKDGSITLNGDTLEQITDINGYNYIILYGKKLHVHRLVAKEYLENPDNLPIVHHINHIKNDNRVENLMWVTHADNMKYYRQFRKENPHLYNKKRRTKFNRKSVLTSNVPTFKFTAPKQFVSEEEKLKQKLEWIKNNNL